MEVQGPLTCERMRDFLRPANLEITEDQLSEAEQERERGGTARGKPIIRASYSISMLMKVYI